jgi:AIPR protein
MDDIKADLLVSEFRDSLEERADKSFKGQLHQAFIDWYVEAEFGQLKWAFTDGPNDGGIDAVVWRKPDDKPPVIILQSKFSDKIGEKQLHKSAYRDFERVVNAFRRKGDVFDEFLDGVAPEIRKIYLKAFKLLDGNWLSAKKAFRLITTSTRIARCEFSLIPTENFVYGPDILNLYRQFRRVLTPKAQELTLTVHDKLSYSDPKRGVTSYLFNARLPDFKKYLDRNDVGRLVARNIRYQLSGEVGRAIRKTYESSAHDFWYLHNGITIVCDDFAERNRTATLTNPSVINGAQTLYAIDRSAVEDSPALVGTRVIVRGIHADQSFEDDAWLQRIIRGVNTQNRVHNYDFRSNEPEQILLQTKFRDLGVFYERKRGEWREFRTDPKYKGFKRLSLPLLGQILMVVSEDGGEGVITAKRGAERIFDDRHYGEIFPPRQKISNRFRKMYIAYRLFELLNDLGYTTAKDYRRQRHAFWNSLWILHRCVVSDDERSLSVGTSSLKKAFDVSKRRKRTRKSMRSLTREVWRAWRIGRKKDPELYTPNNFFKSKYGNQRIVALALPKVRKDLKSLGRELARA